MSLKGASVGRSRGHKGAKPRHIGSHVDVRDNEAYHRTIVAAIACVARTCTRTCTARVLTRAQPDRPGGWGGLDGPGAELKV